LIRHDVDLLRCILVRILQPAILPDANICPVIGQADPLVVGNVAGVAEVESDLETETVFHTVEKGDTLWAVSEKALGSGARYMEIFEANKPMLSHPDKIYPGQVLRIPA